jgi:hypothetical protein
MPNPDRRRKVVQPESGSRHCKFGFARGAYGERLFSRYPGERKYCYAHPRIKNPVQGCVYNHPTGVNDGH